MNPRSIQRAAVLVAMATALPSGGAAAPAPIDATLRCQPAAAPGRVGCELEVEARSGRLTWADVVVLESPSFARPLRARFVAGADDARGDRRARVPISLVATSTGRGTLRVRARAVVCAADDGRRCRAAAASASAEVAVGSEESAKLSGPEALR